MNQVTLIPNKDTQTVVKNQDTSPYQTFYTIDIMQDGSESPKVNIEVSSGSKHNFKPNFFTLTAVFNEMKHLDVRHRCELVTCGATYQMKNAIETDGTLTSGNLEQIVKTYQNTFATTTTEASFTLSQDHKSEQVATIPPKKPPPRNNILQKHLKSSQEIAICGKKNPPKCTFCGMHSNIELCPITVKIGVRLNDKETEKFCDIIN